ncbi:LuxR C-terminal-related transcriptional regulator [Aquella oligotrophica]|uniref:HTH luxR-type domain-containing protein n=1 Tax=Aquella oligotrophica TaxID=2067065 RepID=A0A2I7N6P6_9NEIS|nr:LuxR C-terminal-related transcriptional regulator [Aquella oligotrophica]AUR52110.1 hypothetical protein CUN60_07275 [Aquella oligotrophica]
MRNFEHELAFAVWFSNRYFDDEVAYVKTLSHEIAFATLHTKETLGIKPKMNLLDNKSFTIIRDQIMQVDEILVKNMSDALVVESLLINGSIQIFYWTKKLIKIGCEIYMLVEQAITGELSAKKLLGNHFKPIPRYYSRHQVRFSNQEQCVMYLLANDFSIEEIASLLFITAGTVRTHVYSKIIRKLNMLGYEISNKEEASQLIELLGYGRNMPDKLLKSIRPSSYIVRNL